MYLYEKNVIRPGRSWVDSNGVTHPTNWMSWSDKEKTDAGLKWEDDPAVFDSRFYWAAEVEKALDDKNEVDKDGKAILGSDGKQVVTLGLKSIAINTAKTQANALLSETDWMVVKATEISDYNVPSDVLTYRAAVRTASNNIETLVKDCSNLTEFMAIYTPPDKDKKAPIDVWPTPL
jgi:hypothetical protein